VSYGRQKHVWPHRGEAEEQVTYQRRLLLLLLLLLPGLSPLRPPPGPRAPYPLHHSSARTMTPHMSRPFPLDRPEERLELPHLPVEESGGPGAAMLPPSPSQLPATMIRVESR
jgi:hypothetical protein